MPSQFSNALRAFREKNTSNFNRKYGTTGQAKARKLVREPSQFELAKLALRSESPVRFNEMYGYTSPSSSRPSSPVSFGGKRKTRRSKKSKRGTRTRRR
jgi:hypothetical protein